MIELTTKPTPVATPRGRNKRTVLTNRDCEAATSARASGRSTTPSGWPLHKLLLRYVGKRQQCGSPLRRTSSALQSKAVEEAIWALARLLGPFLLFVQTTGDDHTRGGGTCFAWDGR